MNPTCLQVQVLGCLVIPPLLTQTRLLFRKLSQLPAGLDQCLGLTPHLVGEQPFVLRGADQDMTVLAECAIWVLGGSEDLTGFEASFPPLAGDFYGFRVKRLHKAGEDGHLEAWDTLH